MDAHQPALGGHTKLKKQEPPNSKHNSNRDGAPACGELWAEGLICAFELVRGPRPPNPSGFTPRAPRTAQINDARFASTNASEDGIPNSPAVAELGDPSPVPCKTDQVTRVYEGKDYHDRGSGRPPACHWVPIGWPRINELVQTMHVNGSWASQQLDLGDDGYDLTVADLAAPYWERPVGPTWWCHVAAEHRSIKSWLSNAQWLHPAISTALMDESRLISERMKYLFYEVPVRAAGGLLFELLGQSVGDPFCDEDDIPIVLRCWQTKNCLLTALHIKGSAANINVLGITEVQEILYAGGSITPRSSHEIIAHLACRLSRWDDRLFRKFVFGAADEIELKFVNRRNQEDMNLLCVILNQEIRKLAMQVIRVKWSLHAREEIIFELLQHLKGAITRSILEGIRKSTREMLEEQEAVRGRLFTIQDVMQSTVRAWLQDKSLHITHNLTIFGGCGLVLSIITGLFGINVDGIPGAEHTPFAFALFSGILFLIGIILIGVGMLYFGLKKPLTEEKVHVRRLELEQLVSMFQHDAETHAKVRKDVSRHNLPPTAADMISDTDYILIS